MAATGLGVAEGGDAVGSGASGTGWGLQRSRLPTAPESEKTPLGAPLLEEQTACPPSAPARLGRGRRAQGGKELDWLVTGGET